MLLCVPGSRVTVASEPTRYDNLSLQISADDGAAR